MTHTFVRNRLLKCSLHGIHSAQMIGSTIGAGKHVKIVTRTLMLIPENFWKLCFPESETAGTRRHRCL